MSTGRSLGTRLLAVSADGALHHLHRRDLAGLVTPGDVVVVNDAATLPASLPGRHERTGAAVEVRLAGWIDPGDPRRFLAVLFGAGDHRTPTELRDPPPPVLVGDRVVLGPLVGVVRGLLDHPRLIDLEFVGDRHHIFEGLADHGRPIQYAHVPHRLELADVWTRLAAAPLAFEPPSAGFAIDWRVADHWRRHDVELVSLTHAAGISSTGDDELDARLPFDEAFAIPRETATAIDAARSGRSRIVAVGTTVVRALEAAGGHGGSVAAGPGVATGRIGPTTPLRVVDAVVSGIHAPGESHFELLRAFAPDEVLDRVATAIRRYDYRDHEFGDSMFLARIPRQVDAEPAQSRPSSRLATKLATSERSERVKVM